MENEEKLFKTHTGEVTIMPRGIPFVGTDKIIEGIPPKEESEEFADFDWMGFFLQFDPSILTEMDIAYLLSRKTSLVPRFEDGRIQEDESGIGYCEENERYYLIKRSYQSDAYSLEAISEGDFPYKKKREALIRALGTKVCLYVMERQLECEEPYILSKDPIEPPADSILAGMLNRSYF